MEFNSQKCRLRGEKLTSNSARQFRVPIPAIVPLAIAVLIAERLQFRYQRKFAKLVLNAAP